MTYKVFIESGKGKNRATSGSVPLKKKEDVVKWVQKNPVGNSRTPVVVTKLGTNKTYKSSKIGFSSRAGFKSIIRRRKK